MRIFEKNEIGYAKKGIKKDETLFTINIFTGEIHINPKLCLFPGAKEALRKKLSLAGLMEE